MSMLGAVAEVMMIDAAVSAARGNPGQQRNNNYSPLRMLEAALCFEALDALAGPVVGALGAAALLGGTKADAQPTAANTANSAVTQQPRTQRRQPSLGMNLAPGAPTGM